jgi:hypothetical protein
VNPIGTVACRDDGCRGALRLGNRQDNPASGGGVVSKSGGLIDDMYVSPDVKPMTMEERRKQAAENLRLSHPKYKKELAERESNRKKMIANQINQLDVDIQKQQEQQEAQMEGILDAQKEMKEREKENIATIQIFGIMKKDQTGVQMSWDKMFEALQEKLAANKFALAANVSYGE